MCRRAARVTRIIHSVRRDVHVYEWMFYCRDSDKEDACMHDVRRAASRKSIFNEATSICAHSCRRIIKLVPAGEAYRPTERELTSLS